MVWGIDDIVGGVVGITKTVVDRVVPDRNKQQDQNHEARMAQINAITEGEKARNYFTPKAILLYVCMSPLVYSIIRAFAQTAGIQMPVFDMDISKLAIKILVALMGVS